MNIVYILKSVFGITITQEQMDAAKKALEEAPKYAEYVAQRVTDMETRQIAMQQALLRIERMLAGDAPAIEREYEAQLRLLDANGIDVVCRQPSGDDRPMEGGD